MAEGCVLWIAVIAMIVIGKIIEMDEKRRRG